MHKCRGEVENTDGGKKKTFAELVVVVAGLSPRAVLASASCFSLKGFTAALFALRAPR